MTCSCVAWASVSPVLFHLTLFHLSSCFTCVLPVFFYLCLTFLPFSPALPDLFYVSSCFTCVLLAPFYLSSCCTCPVSPALFHLSLPAFLFYLSFYFTCLPALPVALSLSPVLFHVFRLVSPASPVLSLVHLRFGSFLYTPLSVYGRLSSMGPLFLFYVLPLSRLFHWAKT